MAKAHDLISDGGFEKKHGWDLVEQGESLNYFESGVYREGFKRVEQFADRFGFTYAPPSEGHKAFYTEWDGAQAHVSLSQTVDLAKTSSDVLSFDYEAAWDLKSYGAKADRTFVLEVTDLDTGEVKKMTVLTAHQGERVSDTGLQHFTLDLSEFAGDRVEVNFVWDAPGDNDGPALFMLDNVELEAVKGHGHEGADLAADLHGETPADHFLV